MDANNEPSREPTIETLLALDPAARLEALVLLKDSDQVSLAGQLPSGAVLEMLSLENSQAVRRELVLAEIEARASTPIPSLEEFEQLDLEPKYEAMRRLSNKDKRKLLDQMTAHQRGELIAQEITMGLRYGSAVEHAEMYRITVEDLLSTTPGIQVAMLKVKPRNEQIQLIEGLPAEAKAEMLMQRYKDALNAEVVAGLDAR